jgi:hypothetical protein
MEVNEYGIVIYTEGRRYRCTFYASGVEFEKVTYSRYHAIKMTPAKIMRDDKPQMRLV